MSEQLTVEQLEEQVAKLSPQEQLKLLAHISERLSTIPLATVEDAEKEQRLERARQMLRDMAEGLGSSDPPHDTARNHDKYLYGKP